MYLAGPAPKATLRPLLKMRSGPPVSLPRGRPHGAESQTLRLRPPRGIRSQSAPPLRLKIPTGIRYQKRGHRLFTRRPRQGYQDRALCRWTSEAGPVPLGPRCRRVRAAPHHGQRLLGTRTGLCAAGQARPGSVPLGPGVGESAGLGLADYYVAPQHGSTTPPVTHAATLLASTQAPCDDAGWAPCLSSEGAATWG